MAGNGLGLFLTGLPPALTIDFAGRAEAAGWEAAWFPEITFGDSFGPATAAALQTERIGIATGVVGVWSRSAVTMALQGATLHQLSGGRLILGLGVQARGYVRAWHGQEYRSPITAMRDYVTILRRIFAGELTSYEGEVFSVQNFHLDMELPGGAAEDLHRRERTAHGRAGRRDRGRDGRLVPVARVRPRRDDAGDPAGRRARGALARRLRRDGRVSRRS